MSLYKPKQRDGGLRAEWWYDFSAGGTRYRGSTCLRDKTMARTFHDTLKADKVLSTLTDFHAPPQRLELKPRGEEGVRPWPTTDSVAEAERYIASAAGAFVYCIHESREGLIKIGKSVDPVARLASLQTSAPGVCTLVACAQVVVAEDDEHDEERMALMVESEIQHRSALAGHHVRGEWHKPEALGVFVEYVERSDACLPVLVVAV